MVQSEPVAAPFGSEKSRGKQRKKMDGEKEQIGISKKKREGRETAPTDGWGTTPLWKLGPRDLFNFHPNPTSIRRRTSTKLPVLYSLTS